MICFVKKEQTSRTRQKITEITGKVLGPAPSLEDGFASFQEIYEISIIVLPKISCTCYDTIPNKIASAKSGGRYSKFAF